MMGRPIKNLEGRQFGKWEVLGLSYINKRRKTYWACRCGDCGKVFDVRSDSLTRGKTHRCHKCAAIERTYGNAGAI